MGQINPRNRSVPDPADESWRSCGEKEEKVKRKGEESQKRYTGYNYHSCTRWHNDTEDIEKVESLRKACEQKFEMREFPSLGWLGMVVKGREAAIVSADGIVKQDWFSTRAVWHKYRVTLVHLASDELDDGLGIFESVRRNVNAWFFIPRGERNRGRLMADSARLIPPLVND